MERFASYTLCNGARYEFATGTGNISQWGMLSSRPADLRLEAESVTSLKANTVGVSCSWTLGGEQRSREEEVVSGSMSVVVEAGCVRCEREQTMLYNCTWLIGNLTYVY